MDIQVEDRPEDNQYVALVDGVPGGRAEYILTGDVITFTHTEIDEAHEGKGVGSVLVRAALDDARARSLRVIPLCPFVSAWIGRHPEYVDVVYR